MKFLHEVTNYCPKDFEIEVSCKSDEVHVNIYHIVKWNTHRKIVSIMVLRKNKLTVTTDNVYVNKENIEQKYKTLRSFIMYNMDLTLKQTVHLEMNSRRKYSNDSMKQTNISEHEKELQEKVSRELFKTA